MREERVPRRAASFLRGVQVPQVMARVVRGQLPPCPHLRTARLDAPLQQRLKPGPLAVRQIPTSHGT